MVKVSIKWGKEVFNDVELDVSQPPLVFKSQIFALTGVPCDRMKVMIKGSLLKDDDWGKNVPKDAMTIMVMGSAEAAPVEAPKNLPTFVEDLPEDQQATMDTKMYGAGLTNLGNTCYMNSTVQCLYSVAPLRKFLTDFQPASTADPASKLVVATRDLFTSLEQGGKPAPPFRFLLSLREKFPQFSQKTNDGIYMQQDAEECWTNLMYALREKLMAEDGKPAVDKLFGIDTKLTLKCEESGETKEDTAHAYMLKCNIGPDTNHLHQGISLGLQDDREKHSEVLGRTALFKGASQITHLPPYIPVQLVRFFYKTDVQQKAKILRKVSYSLELDVYDFCAPELRAQLDGPRAAYKAHQDALIERNKRAKIDKAGSSGSSAPATTASTSQDVDMADAASAKDPHVGAFTGRYELMGVLTHKGRSADSGHYTAWIKQDDGKWVLFDDDTLTIRTSEEILNLSGGGDWHMAYMLLYRAVTVPPSL